VQRRVWAHSRADHLLSNEWGTQRSVQSGRSSRAASSAWNGAKGAINGSRVHRPDRWAIGGVIDKVQSLISALGRIKVPSIKLPSLGGLGIVQRQRFDHERWRYVHEAHASAQKMAAGGFANFAQNYQIGEAGREAIVPLIAHSIRVDPAVRFCQPRAR